MSTRPIIRDPGPFEARHIRPKDRYELHDGHAIYCAPTGGDGGRATVLGAQVIDSDPDVEDAAIDAGFAPTPGTLRAPDVSVGVPNKPGWIQGVPPLAIEYASRGQEEESLTTKIADLIAAGTKQVWVVRLLGPRHVEIHTPDQPVRIASGDDLLEAPGILRRPIQAAMLYDRQRAHERVLENHLLRRGYESLDAVLDEGREDGAREALQRLIRRRFGDPPAELEARVANAGLAELERWLDRIIDAPDLEALFAP